MGNSITKSHFPTDKFRIFLYISNCSNWNQPVCCRAPKVCAADNNETSVLNN